MTPTSRALARLAALGLAVLIAGCDRAPDHIYQGWIEADLIFLSPDEQGRVEGLFVREGDTVEKDKPVFALDSDLQRADLAIAEAANANANQAFDRARQLLKSASGTQRDFDAAEAALRQTQAQVSAAQTRLARRRLSSPVAGVVQQVYYRPGETVTAGRPVVAILPPGNVKVRFFIPQPVLARIGIGDTVQVRCDGCPAQIDARISFIARTAEFTPPVIFSEEERAKLVYLVEAAPAQPDALRVGQPVSVAVTPRGGPQ